MASIKENFLLKCPTIIGSEIWFYPCLERGMLQAKELINLYERSAHGRVLVIGEILQAKGRFQRPWLANRGGLWCVLSLYDELLPENRGLLALLWGLALVRTVRSFGVREAKIKWINDLHVRGRKLAGVLTEKWGDWVIAGLGLNVNNDLPSDLPAINLKSLLKKELPLLLILKELLKWLNYYYQKLWEEEKITLEDGSVSYTLLQDMRKYSDTLNRCVYYCYNLDQPEGGFFGWTKDFSEKGGLIMESDHGLVEVLTGEILYL